MPAKYILVHDLGTTSNKAALYDFSLCLVAETSAEYPIYYPKKGWAEQNAEDYWDAVIKTTNHFVSEGIVKPNEIEAMIFDCQMNCTVPVDSQGTPLMRCISWLDTRASKIAEQRYGKGFPKVSGYPLFKILKFIKISGGGPGFNGKDPISHILWIQKNKPEIYEETFKFLSVKDFVIFKCTNNAITSRGLGHTTWLMNSNPGVFDWSDELFGKFNIGRKKLPLIKKSTDIAGNLTTQAADQLQLNPGLPVFVGAGDLLSSAIGSGAIHQNKIHINLGTAAWVAAHTPERLINLSKYIGSICSVEKYLCISKQETGAACFDWLKNEMYVEKIEELGKSTKEIYEHLEKDIKKSPPGANNLIFAPWMYGERSPINDPNVRGIMFNLNLDHHREDLLRAIYEGVAYNLNWSLISLEKMIGPSSEINFIGGGAKSRLWSQILADITGHKINQMENPNLGSARGSAAIALVGLGKLKHLEEASKLIKIQEIFHPREENKKIYAKIFAEFEKLYKNNRKSFKRLNL